MNGHTGDNKMLQAVDGRLVVALQEGLPLDTRPFARIGGDLGLSEAAVLGQVRTLFEAGVARRFGAVFDSRSLGYESTLCAADIPSSELEAVAARIVPHPGITHCYEREGHPNLWFTLTAPARELDRELQRIAAVLGSYEVLNLPALKKFKIAAVFGRGEDDRAPLASPPPTPPPPPLPPLTERERQVVRRLQANIAVVEDPFGLLAGELGYDPAELLALLERWKQAGAIRRIALIVRHEELGFSANSMCVWHVAGDRIAAAGAGMARSPHVTHCYERPASTAFPFNLYAMIHAKTRAEAVGIFERLGAEAGLSDGRMLWSVREFKKTSPVFFREPPPVTPDEEATIPSSERRGILFAAPGTTCPEAMRTYERIGEAAARRFPGVEQRWTYTSSGVRRKLAAQGVIVKDPGEALAAMESDGFTQVAVVSLHLSDGMEFGELAEAADACKRRPGTPPRVALGHALLACETDWQRALRALLAEPPDAPGAPDRIILVAHGSRDPRARETFSAAARRCGAIDRRLILGMMLGTPDLEDVLRECRSAGVKKAWLLPCMVAAGYSAREDIAGTGERSWATALRRADIETTTSSRGLGDVDGIVEIWMDTCERLLAGLKGSNGPGG